MIIAMPADFPYYSVHHPNRPMYTVQTCIYVLFRSRHVMLHDLREIRPKLAERLYKSLSHMNRA